MCPFVKNPGAAVYRATGRGYIMSVYFPRLLRIVTAANRFFERGPVLGIQCGQRHGPGGHVLFGLLFAFGQLAQLGPDTIRYFLGVEVDQ